MHVIFAGAMMAAVVVLAVFLLHRMGRPRGGGTADALVGALCMVVAVLFLLTQVGCDDGGGVGEVDQGAFTPGADTNATNHNPEADSCAPGGGPGVENPPPTPTSTLQWVCRASCWITIRPDVASSDIHVCLTTQVGLDSVRTDGVAKPTAQYSVVGVRNASKDAAKDNARVACPGSFNLAYCSRSGSDGVITSDPAQQYIVTGCESGLYR